MTKLLVWLAFLLSVVNLWSFFLFWHDKQQSRVRGQRISEASLLLLAFGGGGFGALLSSRAFRHKTRKQPFATLLVLIAGLQFGALIGWLALGMPLPAALVRLLQQA